MVPSTPKKKPEYCVHPFADQFEADLCQSSSNLMLKLLNFYEFQAKHDSSCSSSCAKTFAMRPPTPSATRIPSLYTLSPHVAADKDSKEVVEEAIVYDVERGRHSHDHGRDLWSEEQRRGA